MLHRTHSKNYSKGRSPIVTLILAVATLSFSVAGCSSGESTLGDVEALKTKVCACKDVACVTALRASSEGLEQKLSKLTGDEMDEALKLAVAMNECATKLGVPSDGL